MSGEPTVTIIGNLGADPELRFTPNGKPVANVSIGSTPRRYNRETGQYDSGETFWVRAHIWGEAAENVAESLKKGDRVIAHGRLEQRNYTTREGISRTGIELQVQDIGPALRYARAQVQRQDAGGIPQMHQQPSRAPQPQATQWGSGMGQPLPQDGPYGAAFAVPQQFSDGGL